MARAFVIDWNPEYWNTPLVIKPQFNYTGSYGPNGQNECTFEFDSGVYTNMISYPTKTARDAQTLCRLAQLMSKFQLYCRLTNTIDWCVQNHAEQNINQFVHKERDYLNSLPNRPYYYQKLDDKNVPFNVSEIDTKEAPNFKPCFFCEEYVLQDEKGYPLHVVIMLEKTDTDSTDNSLFKYNVKFIASNKSLAKMTHRVPLCDDTAAYEQKCEDYKTSHQFYYDDLQKTIYDLICSNGFNKHFKSYDYKANEKWDICEPVRRGISCPDSLRSFGVGKLECWNPRCQFYKTTHEKRHHDGQEPYTLFKNAFGPKIAELVKNGEFGPLYKDLMPDVSDPQFIKPFNAFLCKEKLSTPIHYFDNDGIIQRRKTALEKQKYQIQNWTSTLTNGPLRVSSINGQTYQFPNPFNVKSTETKTQEPTPQQKPTPDFQERKERMQYRLMSRIIDPAIFVASPGKIQITNVFEAPYMSEIAKDEYDTFTDLYVTYKKPQHKENQEITYRFKHEPLAYDLLDTMRDIQRLQSEGNNLKWTRAKLFSKDKGPATTDPHGLSIRMEEKADVITPLQPNKSYNGITILEPQTMKQIACHHYKLRTIDWGGDAHNTTEILLFGNKDTISGIIHSRKPETIIPKIVVEAVNQKTK
ncbi:MAG: hypothetical protein K5912_03785 [Alphaproteobacteria bacterium]|nr:hypothetical protein [Alphaproteobacteria bacterium]